MDENRRRQNEGPQYSGSASRYGSGSDQARGRGYDNVEQFRGSQGPMNPVSSAGRGVSGSASYGYYPDATSTTFSTPLPPNSMQYQPDYAPDQRQQQHQQHHPQSSYGGYNSNMLYGVGQTAPQAGVYDASPQYQQQQRQPAAMQIMPDVATSYYPSDHSGTPNAAIHPVLQHPSVPDAATSYQPTLPAYASGMHMAPLDQSPITQLETPENVAQGNATEAIPEAYAIYQNTIKRIFYNIQENKLAEAAVSLLQVSDWLLSNVSRLGLIGDDETLREPRLTLWTEFNQAWLTLLQRQKDLTQDDSSTLPSIRPPPPPQFVSLITLEDLWKMSKEVVRLADSVESHGLVDYELGIWEESIMEILLECIDILDGSGASGDEERPPRSGRPPT